MFVITRGRSNKNPHCCTWLIALACWLLPAPSLGMFPHSIFSGLAALFAAKQQAPVAPNALPPDSFSLLTGVNLSLSQFLSPSSCPLSDRVLRRLPDDLPTLAVYTRPLTVHSLWAPSSPPSSPSPSSYSAALPLTLPLTASLSFAECGFETLEFMKKKTHLLSHSSSLPLA